MSVPDDIRIALVGCGRISRNHFESIDRIDGMRVTAVCDVDEERAREAGERLGVPWFRGYDEMLARSECDVVSICTPSGLHPAHGIQAARAGKHVVSEKPMGISLVAGENLFPNSQNLFLESRFGGAPAPRA